MRQSRALISKLIVKRPMTKLRLFRWCWQERALGLDRNCG